jgi:uncharacterized membrane protein YoaK (UPF0700 family)
MTHPARLFSSPTAAREGLVLLLAFAAGCVDAISYLGLGHIFSANMTGNTVLLGLSLAQAQWPAALHSAVALAGYLTGVAGGAILIERAPAPAPAPKDKRALWPPVVTTVFALEWIILAALTLAGALLPAASSGASVSALIVLAAAAMGLQGVAARSLGVRGVATTFITGTWTSMMSGLVNRIPSAQREGAEPPTGTGTQAAVVGVYLLAAVGGGVAATRWQLLAFTVPTVVIAVVVMAAWLRFRGRTD